MDRSRIFFVRASVLGALTLAALFGASAEAQEGAPVESPPNEGATAEAGPDDPADEPPAPPSLEPPRLVHAEDPVYPPARLSEGAHPTVVLQVVLSETGEVAHADVEHSAGEDFDAAALEVIHAWRFEPARRDGEPIPSRVRVAVHFELPAFDLPHAGAPPSGGHILGDDDVEPADLGPPHSHGGDAPVHGAADEDDDAPSTATYGATGEAALIELRAEERSISDVRLDREILEAVPAPSTDGLLRSVPGLYVGRPEGPAVASQLMLRGFDADHGQDIELTLQGIPINQPSHIHGQGYGDLHFIIPEVVQSVRVIEGVYDPRQGDFAVAGTIDFELGVERRGLYLASSFGNFGTFREVGIFAPEGRGEETFGAVSFETTQGFGENRAGLSSNGIFQIGLREEGPLRLRLLGTVAGARSDLAGVVRDDDVEAGSVGFYDVYDLPTALAQNASNARLQVALQGEHRGEGGSNTSFDLWFLYQDFRLEENYTGFTQRSEIEPTWVGRGDLIEQQNSDLGFGFMARHRTARFEPLERAKGTVELGTSARLDLIDQQQNLIQEPQGRTWDNRVDASITGLDIGLWLDLDWEFSRYFAVKGGVRADALYYVVDDRLGNRTPAFRPTTSLPGYRYSAAGVAAGPRVSLEGRPDEHFTLFGAYGEGYRSPQARLLSEGERAPYTKVRSGDVGVRYRLDEEGTLDVRLGGYLTQLSDDLVFEPAEGRLERVGPTRRLGWQLYATSRPVDWLVGAFSLTYVHATLEEPPPATAEDPTPPYEEGQLLPFVPPWVMRLDLHAAHPVAELGAHELKASGGLGFNYISSRPLPFGQEASPVSLLDLSAGLEWGRIELRFDIFNLVDSRYAAVEYYFVSNWDPETAPTRVPERHTAAGSPRTYLFTIGLTL